MLRKMEVISSSINDEYTITNTNKKLQRGEINKNYIQKFDSEEEAAWFEEHWQRIRTHSNLYIACPHCKSVVCSFRNLNTHIVNNHHDMYKRCTCLLCNKLLTSDSDGDKHKARCMYLNRRRDLDNKNFEDHLKTEIAMKSKKSNIELDARHSELAYLQNNIKDKLFAINCFLDTIQNANLLSGNGGGSSGRNCQTTGIVENRVNVNNYFTINSTIPTDGGSNHNSIILSANPKPKLMELSTSESITHDDDNTTISTPITINTINSINENNIEHIPGCSKKPELDFTKTFFHKKRLAMLSNTNKNN